METKTTRVGTTPDARRGMLRQLLNDKKPIRVMEAHSPLSALLIEAARYGKDEDEKKFDAFWSSSLTDSTMQGQPDTELLDYNRRFKAITDIFHVTTIPLIFDGDTGGQVEHLSYHVRQAENMGISALIIEDKTGLKKNSLFGNDVTQTQASVDEFCEKLSSAKRAQLTPEFMLIARVESLILDAGMDDAINRSLRYVEAGADGIMIHSRHKDPDEILEFAKIFRSHHKEIPLVCVPTSFNHITFQELVDHGFNIIIYANHMLRASYPAMRDILPKILENGRTEEIEGACLSIIEILNLIPGTR
ncbi:phosphoenolpyruvate mutase [Lonsdalea populi]|uniref:phosphoenolpyruvate mutase n=1 Tax=Lonsdalea populi TaxID=1172565 RepID=A0A3N0UGN6_9GAMM|nr:phosphoenolpyruvate mutase [Lonsdalea populi]OSM97424.1 phosphoenolpyruvate mutase [Lonsdalea populi]RAT73004.1 phosphoenolpyruvate mutase [Lonsdalea populi]RAT74228.1 phosphoenolpyruvate mutase [Lonsdalea populi]RAT75736.1 phosphoenolpyruvate mutase [Lonsdalea populi]RAT77702.1 phosphoenolpyruvate mutase [Lonsdalea populi]